MKKKSASLYLFLIGLGSQTQIYFIGSIGISELILFLIGPILFFLDYHQLKGDGFMPFIWLSILTCLGCVLSGTINHTDGVFLLKGLAAPYSVFVATVVIHRILRRDFSALKWFILGTFLSGIISIFVFQQATYVVRGGVFLEGSEATNAVMSNPLFWSSKIAMLLSLPISMGYLSTPYSYSAIMPFIMALIRILFSDSSGRAAALVSCLAGFYIAIAGKSVRRMRQIGRNFIFVVMLLVVFLMVGKQVYVYAAANNYLGEKAREKYYKQTQGSSSALKIIMGGRIEFFTAIRACFDKPIIGFGPKPLDEKGYYEDMLRSYGNPDDYDAYTQSRIAQAKVGITAHFIPAHSYLASFWLQYGIIGLFFWLYVLWMFLKFFTKYSYGIPQWYGYCTLAIAGFLWDIFFSPFSGRIATAVLMSCILFARAVIWGRVSLPWELQDEVMRRCQ